MIFVHCNQNVYRKANYYRNDAMNDAAMLSIRYPLREDLITTHVGYSCNSCSESLGPRDWASETYLNAERWRE